MKNSVDFFLKKIQFLAWSARAGSTPGGRRTGWRSETGTGPAYNLPHKKRFFKYIFSRKMSKQQQQTDHLHVSGPEPLLPLNVHRLDQQTDKLRKTEKINNIFLKSPGNGLTWFTTLPSPSSSGSKASSKKMCVSHS